MSPQRHVILRQTVELVVARGDDAWSLQQEASRLMRKIEPLIERYCDELSAPDRLHRIERLELDLGVLDPRRLEEELLVKFGETLRRGLAEQIGRRESAELSPKIASQLELFSQFVRQGCLPWWADLAQANQPGESLDTLLREAPELLGRLLPELAGDARALQRLAGYFDDRRLAALVVLKAPALADFLLALFEALLLLPGHLPNLAATPPSRFRNHLWQSILGNATLSAQPPADLLDFSRGVLMRLACLQAISYPALVQGFAQAAAVGRFQGMAKEVAAALDVEYRSGTVSTTMKRLAESAREAPRSRLWSGETGEAALEALRLWSEHGILEPVPSWLQSWPKALREALFARLSGMGENLGEALVELRGWLERGLQDRTPSWLQEWPPLLREEFAAQLWELGKRPEVGPTARHETLSPALADATLAKQWQEALEQARYSDADAIYLGNAGLVILWPFLQTFFGRLGLLEDNRFIDEAARQRGAALLQCLASADTAPPEYLLPLNKVLCGMALESVFELDTPLSEEEVAECNALLEAVIAQAPILNDMSIQGFRGSFLLRAGVLEVRDGAWLLRVERETYDLVLDRFPWGFEWVRLPWMETPLRVEW